MSRLAFYRRGLHPETPTAHSQAATGRPSPDRRHRSALRRGRMCPLTRLLWSGLALVALSFFLVGAWQISVMNGAGESNNVAFSGGSGGRGERPDGSFLRFVPSDLEQRFRGRRIALDRRRSGLGLGLRPPRLALVTEGTNKNSYLLMLLTLVKSLMDLGYTFMVFVLENSRSGFLWENIGCQVSVLNNERSASIDWSIYEGVILSSVEGRKFIPRLMQDPFMSVPLIWLIHEDILGKRLSHYAEWGWHDLISEWSIAFTRADVVVFPDFSFPILHSLLDKGNFYVISGYPVDMWATNDYIASHSRLQLREDFKFSESDLLILVLGDYFIYHELPWDAVMETLIPQVKMAKYLNGTLKFVFLCCVSTDASSSTLQEVASRMGFPDGSIRQYGTDQDLKSFLLMVDIVLYWSYNVEQSFPPPLLLAMSFEIPVVAPNLSVIEKYVVDSVHGILFDPRQLDTLDRALSLLIEDKKLSNFAKSVASHGKLLSINMLASECIVSYAQLLENVLHFSSDTLIPYSSSQIQQKTWLWDLLDREIKPTSTSVQVSSSSKDKDYLPRPSIVHLLEEEYSRRNLEKSFQIENMTNDFPNESDWDIVNVMHVFEDYECRESQELDERIERTSGSWEDVYRNARKSDKQKAEAYERDEGELRRTGQSLIIYEVYSGEGAWPLLHHGSIYRGLSLSYSGRRSKSEDVEAVSQLPFLNDTYYKDILCETRAMFAVANRVDYIHKLPWIGFQSWRAYGRRVSLSPLAERVLEKAIQEQPKGDIMYYWAVMNIEVDKAKTNKKLDFWSICDHLNAAQCRVVFADAFRQMYGLPPEITALPPMPFDGDHWSILHSWAMPTSSFLEFIMFARMFADSLDCLTQNSSSLSFCVLGSSELERRNCYCRVLEVLVNVWAYHSARRMVYLNPSSGIFKEQHPLDRRHMWVKYFNFDLLKSMDEVLAEKADDGMHPRDRWLWPLTGEVHWQGIVDREREERMKQKMDKKKKTMVKLLGRHKHGYKQKSLGLK